MWKQGDILNVVLGIMVICVVFSSYEQKVWLFCIIWLFGVVMLMILVQFVQVQNVFLGWWQDRLGMVFSWFIIRLWCWVKLLWWIVSMFCGLFSVLIVVVCVIEQGFEVDWFCIMVIVWISGCGFILYLMCQFVIVQVLLMLLMIRYLLCSYGVICRGVMKWKLL